MNLSKLAAIALTALLVSAGAAAAIPGQADDAGAAHADEHAKADEHTKADGHAQANGQASAADDNASDAAADGDDAALNASDGGNESTVPDAANASRGPPADLPEQVPDHVSQIHDLINQFLAGGLDGLLGEHVSGVASDDAGNSQNATADAGSDASDEQAQSAN